MNPLVSVITRTLGRTTIAEVAGCLSAQTYRPLEWVVVNASGAPLPPLPSPGGIPVLQVGGQRRLPRSQALNAGLGAATGRYHLILDDDDLILPGHVGDLIAVLAAHPGVLAAHSDAETIAADGSVTGRYEFEFSHLLLTRRNLFPPHAVLFDAGLVRDRGCRIDEALEYFEDWDFWLQIARHTSFARSPRATAIYRTYLSQSGVQGGAAPDAIARMRDDQARLVARNDDVRSRLQSGFDALVQEALVAQARGDFALAASHYNAALRADPANVDILGRYAELAMRVGDLAMARASVDLALKLEPGEPTAHWNLAIVLAAQGLHAEAAAARDRAIALDPTIATQAGESPA